MREEFRRRLIESMADADVQKLRAEVKSWFVDVHPKAR